MKVDFRLSTLYKMPNAVQLSIIIPTRNEESTIGDRLKELRATPEHEAIVVDGASTDRTRDIAREFDVTVIESVPGRAIQQNEGAARAHGKVLLFLHADTALPPNFVQHIDRTLNRTGVVAGAFELRIDAPGVAFRIIERGVALRARRLQMPYGDQAIFMPADVFNQVGGFPDVPILEDYLLVRKLKRMGRIAIAPAPVLTSARRWHKHGVLRTSAINLGCVAAFRLGAKPDSIACWRYPRRPDCAGLQPAAGISSE